MQTLQEIFWLHYMAPYSSIFAWEILGTKEAIYLVHAVTKSWTRLSKWSYTQTYTHENQHNKAQFTHWPVSGLKQKKPHRIIMKYSSNVQGEMFHQLVWKVKRVVRRTEASKGRMWWGSEHKISQALFRIGGLVSQNNTVYLNMIGLTKSTFVS